MKHLLRLFVIFTVGLILSLGLHRPVSSSQATIIPPASSLKLVQAQTPDLIETGKQYYEAGQFAQAMLVWQEAQQSYQRAGELINQALASSFVSLAAQELGQWQEAQQAIQTSLSLLETFPQGYERVKAQVFNAQARLQLLRGKSEMRAETWQDGAEAALTTWQKAEALYNQVGDRMGILGTQINQAQAMQVLGLNYQATELLEQIQESLREQPELQSIGLRTLGNLLRQTGDLEASQTKLEEALAIAQAQGLPQEQSLTLISLGNTIRAYTKKEQQQDWQQTVLNYYHEAADLATIPLLKIQAQLNQLSLLVETQQWDQSQSLWQQIPTPLNHLNPSRPAIYAQVNLAKNLACLKLKQKTANCPLQEVTEKEFSDFNSDLDQPSWQQIIQLLNQAAQKAQVLPDRRSQSYALGNLGQVYEAMTEIEQRTKSNYDYAKQYTEQALSLAQQIQASDLAYQWQWQLGRLLKTQHDHTSAIAFYSQAVNSLQSLRGDLVTLNPDVQLDFREKVEPVYRELVDLLLDVDNPQPSQTHLKQARQVIESLQLAQLDDFFRDACLQAKPEQLDEIVDQAETPTAAFYAIVLSDRLEIILKLPKDNELRHYRTLVTQAEIELTLEQMRDNLVQPKPSTQLPQLSQQIYHWLITPAEADLEQHKIQTLTFVLDFSLQNIPLAALDDGEHYLIEKYALALSPGLQLLEPEPVTKTKLNVLAAGVSERQTIGDRIFDPLNAVPVELQQIQEEVADSEKLLNSEFIETNLRKQIESLPFSVIHIATHGNFSSDPENTFILLWNQLFKAKDINNLLSNDLRKAKKIELLALSACQTAKGDKRASLGLAGVALRAGARSTLATLWQVDDLSTADLMIRFYRELQENSNLTKAEALRRAQIYLLENHPNFNYKLPYYWAPFVLVGNWL
jgi:CHAT domain-containing protein